ncbi:Uncharacterised protein [Escherichia coli]|nr:Uncharacterised protein [Escherichia coli]
MNPCNPLSSILPASWPPSSAGTARCRWKRRKCRISAGHTVTIGDREVLLFRDWQQWQFSLEERLQPDAALFTQPGTRLTAVTLLLSEDGELTWKNPWPGPGPRRPQQPTENTHE